MNNLPQQEINFPSNWLKNIKLPDHSGQNQIRESTTAESIPSYVGLNHTGKILARRDRRLRRRRHAITCLHTPSITQSLHSEAKRFIQAAGEGNKEKVLDMLDHGTDPTIRDEKGRTALHVASAKGCTEIVSVLLNRGAEANQRDSIGNTPLHLAACTNHIGVITLLVNAGCQIEDTAQCGITPLSFVRGRLKLLQGNTSRKSEAIKTELMQIIELMQSLHQRQRLNAEVSWSDVTSKLHQADTVSDIDAITGLLGNISILSTSTQHANNECQT